MGEEGGKGKEGKEEKEEGGQAIYADGPKMGNDAYRSCGDQTWVGTLDQAKTKCDADPKCGVIHDWNCDGVNWRVCSYSLKDLMKEKGAKKDEKACTKVRATYAAGPKIGNDAYRSCGDQTWVGTLDQAKKKCDADAKCGVIMTGTAM